MVIKFGTPRYRSLKKKISMYPLGCSEKDCDYYKEDKCRHKKAKLKNKGECDGGIIDCIHWEMIV